MNAPDNQTRLDELESRLAFQDDLIENLNEVVARQDREISHLTLQLAELAAKLAEVAEAAPAGASAATDEVPPHY